MVGLGRSQAIDTGDTGHNDDIIPLKEGAGGGVSHLIDLFIDLGVLLDIGVSRWDIGFGLIIIVIADKKFDSILRKEFLKFPIELGSQGFIMGDDQGGLLYLLNHISHGEGLPRTGHPQKDLVWNPL